MSPPTDPGSTAVAAPGAGPGRVGSVVRRLLLVAGVVALNLAGWWALNPTHAPIAWHDRFECLSYWSSDDRTYDPDAHVQVRPETIDRELALLAEHTGCVRTYHVTNGMQAVPEIAARHGLEVMLGVWVSGDRAATQRQLEVALALANTQANVTRLIVGNETIQHNSIELAELIAYLDEARVRTGKPVTTAENWFVWLNEPALATAVDFAMLHILPYWHESQSETAVAYAMQRYEWVRGRFPGLELVIGEIGWPSSGPLRGASVPSAVAQARFVREFATYAAAHGIHYNLLEAFDQPWKIESPEGRVGAHWGLLTADGEAKFALVGPVVADAAWPWWVAISSLAMLLLSAWFFARQPRLRLRGDVLTVMVIQLLTTLATLVVVTTEREYLLGQWLVWLLVFPTVLLILLVVMALLVEVAEVIGEAPLPVTRHALAARPAEGGGRRPFVSIHVPCRNEPPEMVMATLASLLALDYPAFEVVVVDNNSSDESFWRPVEAFAARHPDTIRFHVLHDWPGFKAGALNYALGVTAPEAEIIAVVDADYVVARDWLACTVPLFGEPGVAVVQGPQDHREHGGSAFGRMAYDEYAGFFQIGMIQRNEHNAIIQHGTMTLISRAALEKAGRWSEWCIVEDAELGLRLHALGYRAIYVARSFGRGLVPTTFAAACTQRYRWAYGAVRVTLAHWRTLFGLRPKAGASGVVPRLTRAQRFRYLAGWLPWFADAFHLAFSLLGLIASGFFFFNSRSFPPPELALPFIAFSLLRWAFTFATYRKRMPIGLKRTLAAALVGLAFTNTIGSAVVRALFSGRLPFLRTDKARAPGRAPGWLKALGKVRLDMALALGLSLAAALLLKRYGPTTDALVWALVLGMQAVPGLAAILLTFIGSPRRVPVVVAAKILRDA